MNTKILWLSDNLYRDFGETKSDQDLVFANMLEFARSVARPSTEFVINTLTHTVGAHSAATYRYQKALMAVEVLERVKQAEDDGFDAAFPGMCFGEFFLQDARQTVKMPVVGPAESAMTLAQLLGDKFAVLTVHPRYIHRMEENIRMHGWQGRAISNPVRAWEPAFKKMMVDAYNGRPDQMIEEFEREALKLVRDGADVVVFGCNPLGAALSQAGYNEVANTGVPVVTALPAMIKLAESLVDLRRTLGITRTEAVVGPYRSTPDNVLEDLAARGMGLPAVRKPGLAAAEAYAPVTDHALL
jgi:allantoin racemase